MRSYISEDLRCLIAARAGFLCEYCLIHEDDTFFGCEVDYIISLKHGGTTEADNLAYACVFCNRQKGSDIGSILWQTGAFIRFFNPRTDQWGKHFQLRGAVIEPLTEIREVTAHILHFNDSDREMKIGKIGTAPIFLRYVENNPVRAGIVTKAEDYLWSSAREHEKRNFDGIVSPSCYLVEEIKDWHRYLREHQDQVMVDNIRRGSMTGRPCGDEKFIRKLEKKFGRRLQALPHGRPQGKRK